MTDFFLRYILPPALAGSLMVLLLALARPLLGRLPARLRRGALLGAGAMFLLPMAPLMGLVARLSRWFAAGGGDGGQLSAAAAQGLGAAPAIAPAYQAGHTLSATAALAQPVFASSVATGRFDLSAALVLAAGWLYAGVALALLMGSLWRYLTLMRRLRRHCRPAGNGPLAAQYSLACVQANIPAGKGPALAIGPVTAPLLAGLLRPRLVMPESGLDRQQTLLALKHELTHWRQRDIALKLGATLLCCLYWFTPCAWVLRRQLANACEESCDERVAAGLDSAGRRLYADTLLALAGPGATPGVALAGPARRLRRRLQRLVCPAKAGKAAKRAALAAVAVFAAAALLAGCGLAAGSEDASGALPPSSSSAAGPSSQPEPAGSGTGDAGSSPAPMQGAAVMDSETLRAHYASIFTDGEIIEHEGKLYIALPNVQILEEFTQPQPDMFMLKLIDASGQERYNTLVYPLKLPDFMGEATWASEAHSITLSRACPADTPVLTAATGKVLAVLAGDNGTSVAIEHPDGFITEYGGLASASVEVGQTVSDGLELGRSSGEDLVFTMACAESHTPVMVYTVKNYSDEEGPFSHTSTLEVRNIPAS